VESILRFAASSGISVLDTSPAYGSSEQLLGQASRGIAPLRIVTKTRVNLSSGQQLEDDLMQSLHRLQRASVDGLLMHRSEDLLSDQGPEIYAALVRQKELGRVRKIGISVYSSAEINAVLKRYPINLVQLPISVLDQRMLQSGHLDKLKNLNIEIHARSVFLQGVLLMDPESLSGPLQSFQPLLQDYRARLQELDISPLAAALNFVRQIPEVDVALCGVNSLQHLQEIVAAATTKVDTASFAEFALDQEALLNPSLWR
jgi:aryl-alcohol dehydrogenase-like predicted oxidoreductase